VAITAIHIHRVAGGKLAEHWEAINLLPLLQQLGVVGSELQARRHARLGDGGSGQRANAVPPGGSVLHRAPATGRPGVTR
jgi:hypothetical protein